jgi:hypothetical protein
MATKRHDLTPELIHQMAALVRAGCHPDVAAETAGLPASLFNQWLRIGQKAKKPCLHRDLSDAVRTASAQARAKAEMEVFATDPRTWLKSGPGKEREGRPGWSTVPKPSVTINNNPGSLLMQPEMVGLFSYLLQVLKDFPEARVRLSEALSGLKDEPKRISDVTT